MMIKWENISLLCIIIYLTYKVIHYGKYIYKIDVLIHYLLINILFILLYRFYMIIKKEVVAHSAKSLTTSTKTTQR